MVYRFCILCSQLPAPLCLDSRFPSGNKGNEADKVTDRTIEPFALLSTRENWLLVAWCRLRQEFRYFRLDRIRTLEVLSEKFAPHGLTLQAYFVGEASLKRESVSLKFFKHP